MDMESKRGFLKSVIVMAQRVMRCAVEYLSPDFIWEIYRGLTSLEVIKKKYFVNEDLIQVLDKYPSRDCQQLRRRLMRKGLIDCMTMTACSLIAYREKKALSLVPPAILVCRWRSLCEAQNVLRKVKQLMALNKQYDSILQESFTKLSNVSIIGQALSKRVNIDVTSGLEITEIDPPRLMAWYHMPDLRIAMMDTMERLALAFDGAFLMHTNETTSLAVNLEQQALCSQHLDPELEPAQKDTIPSLRALTDILDLLHIARSAFFRNLILEHNHNTCIFDNVVCIMEECLKQQEMAVLEQRWTINEATPFLRKRYKF